MSYQIIYKDCVAERRGTSPSPMRFAGMVTAFFVGFLLLTYAFWPDGRAKLQKVFLPGDPEITGQAVAVLVDDLRGGEPLHDAVTTFCQEILEHAENTD